MKDCSFCFFMFSSKENLIYRGAWRVFQFFCNIDFVEVTYARKYKQKLKNSFLFGILLTFS